MSEEIKIAIVGLDTSHATAFPKLMQDPTTPAEQKISGLRVINCLRFETAFQNKEGLDKRQAYLESIGVNVTENFDEAVAGCDAIMIEINDPSLHLEYFEKCAPLGKPIFLDKPFADTVDSMCKIIELAKKYNVRFFTSSSLRFDIDFVEGLEKGLPVEKGMTWGPAGIPPKGPAVIWYGCHTFEMIQRIMGRGAESVRGVKEGESYLFRIKYADGRTGIVELGSEFSYGALIRTKETEMQTIKVTGRVPFYYMLMKQFVKFLQGEQPVELEDSVEVMALQEAALKSIESGKAEPVFHL